MSIDLIWDMAAQSTTTVQASPLLQRLKASPAEIAAFCQRWHIQELSLFGSVVRSDFGLDSDIVVLIVPDFQRERDVFLRVLAKDELEVLLGRDVDLTEKRQLKNPFSRLEILQTHRIIYPPKRANFSSIIEAAERMTDDVRNNAALLDMIDSLKALQEFVQNRAFKDYLEDRFFRSAVERELENVGEAANRLTTEFQIAHPEISWRGIVGLRNAIIHQYDELDYENIWVIATEKVPVLLKQVELLVAPLPEGLED